MINVLLNLAFAHWRASRHPIRCGGTSVLVGAPETTWEESPKDRPHGGETAADNADESFEYRPVCDGNMRGICCRGEFNEGGKSDYAGDHYEQSDAEYEYQIRLLLMFNVERRELRNGK